MPAEILAPVDYQFLGQLVYKKSGLVLGPGQEYLAVSRLTPLLKTFNVTSVAALVQVLRTSNNGDHLRIISEALATHESLFFRDRANYTFVTTRVAEMCSVKPNGAARKIRMWSSACSTGQEPYSMLIALDELRLAALPNLNFEILATDFSSHAVAKAQAGVFSEFEVKRGLTPAQVQRYMEPHPQGYIMRDSYRRRIQFTQHNLLDGFTRFGQFDFIFCCNVLIYFDLKTRIDIFERFANNVTDDGHIVLGASESASSLTKNFVVVASDRGGILKRRPPTTPAAAAAKTQPARTTRP